MRKFQVTVNGQMYEVEVEEVEAGAQTSAPAARPVVAAPAAPKPAKASTPSAVGTGEPIKAPMPGNILNVMVKVGDNVKTGEPVVILEAMKMENPIPAPHDGVITSVQVEKGATVEVGAVIATIA